MTATINIFAVTFRSVFAWWPLILLTTVEAAIIGRGRLLTIFRRSLRNLGVFWVIWAAMRVALFFWRTPTKGIIPEPFNTYLFLFFGLLLGVFVSLILRRRLLVQRILFRSPHSELLQNLSTNEFEDLVAEAYRQSGYPVMFMESRSRDGVLMMVDAHHGAKWIVLCAHSRGQVGESSVRRLFGDMYQHNASRGVIITTSHFSMRALLWSMGKPIHLYDGWSFLDILRRAQRVQIDKNDEANLVNDPLKGDFVGSLDTNPRCPHCNERMVVRSTKWGGGPGDGFFSCLNYPSCRILLPVREFVTSDLPV